MRGGLLQVERRGDPVDRCVWIAQAQDVARLDIAELCPQRGLDV